MTKLNNQVLNLLVFIDIHTFLNRCILKLENKPEVRKND